MYCNEQQRPGDGSFHMKRQGISKNYLRKPRERPLSMIRIRPRAGNSRKGWLTAPGLTIPVALGRGGILANKREGDGGTPRGVFYPLRIWWRAARLPRPKAALPVQRITRAIAWSENPQDR